MGVDKVFDVDTSVGVESTHKARCLYACIVALVTHTQSEMFKAPTERILCVLAQAALVAHIQAECLHRP